MNSSKNGYNKIITGGFVVVFLCLFLSAYTDLIVSFGFNQISAFGVSVIVLVIFGAILYGLYKLLNNKNQGSNWSTAAYVVCLCIDALIFIVFRMLAFGGIIGYRDDLGDIAMRAMISDSGKLYLDFSNLDSVFSSLLSLFFKFFGNTYFALYFLQFILMSIAYAVILIFCHKAWGRTSAVVMGLGIAVSGFSIRSMTFGNAYNLFMIVLAMTLLLLLRVYSIAVNGKYNYLWLGIYGLIMGVIYLNSEFMLSLLIVSGIMILVEGDEYLSDKLKAVAVYFGSAIIIMVIICLADSLISGENIAEVYNSIFHNRFAVHMGLGSGNYDIVWYMGLIFALPYLIWILSKKNDRAYVLTYIMIIAGIQSVLLGQNENGSLYMLLLVGMLIMASRGIETVLCIEKGVSIMNNDYELKQDVAEHFEDLQPEIVDDAINVIGGQEDSHIIEKDNILTESVDEFKFEDLKEDDRAFEFDSEEIVTSNEPDYVENIDSTNEAEPEYIDEHIQAEDDKPEFEWDDIAGEFVKVEKPVNSANDDNISSQETFFDDDLESEEKANENSESQISSELPAGGETDNAEVQEEPVELIENPLPLPKKHEHREMDYGRIIPVSLMHYDYEVTPDKNHYDY